VEIAAVAIALSVGGAGLAHGSGLHARPRLAAQAAGKKRHVLSADYKSGPIGVDDTTATTDLLDDQAKLVGRPFGGTKMEVNELSVVTYNMPGPSPRNDSSGTEHTTFKAVPSAPGNSSLRGFYDISLDSGGNPSGPISGTITGGKGAFRGARGSFQVLDRVAYPVGDTTGYKAHWQGSIRY